MALFTEVQHLCIFNIVAPLIYHLLPNVWKAPHTISVSIFVDVPYWPPHSMNKFISFVVPGPPQWFFHFDKEIVNAWTHIGWVRWMFQRSVTGAAVWLLALSRRMTGFGTTTYRRFLLSAGQNVVAVEGSGYLLTWRYSMLHYYPHQCHTPQWTSPSQHIV